MKWNHVDHATYTGCFHFLYSIVVKTKTWASSLCVLSACYQILECSFDFTFGLTLAYLLETSVWFLTTLFLCRRCKRANSQLLIACGYVWGKNVDECFDTECNPPGWMCCVWPITQPEAPTHWEFWFHRCATLCNCFNHLTMIWMVHTEANWDLLHNIQEMLIRQLLCRKLLPHLEDNFHLSIHGAVSLSFPYLGLGCSG